MKRIVGNLRLTNASKLVFRTIILVLASGFLKYFIVRILKVYYLIEVNLKSLLITWILSANVKIARSWSIGSDSARDHAAKLDRWRASMRACGLVKFNNLEHRALQQVTLRETIILTSNLGVSSPGVINTVQR